MQQEEKKSEEQPDSTQDSKVSTELNESAMVEKKSEEQPDSTQDSKASTELNESAIVEKKSEEKPELSQDSSVSTESNESARTDSPNRPSGRKVASVRQSRLQKKKRLGNLNSEKNKIQKIIKRGYYEKEIGKRRKEHVPIDAAEKEYLRAKVAALKAEIKLLKIEISGLTKGFKALAKDAKKAHNEDLQKINERNRVKSLSVKIVAKVKIMVTLNTLQDYPSLAPIAKAAKIEEDSVHNLMDFFSTNMADEYKKFKDDEKLAAEIVKKTFRHIQRISN